MVRVHVYFSELLELRKRQQAVKSVVQGIIQLTIFKLQKNLQWIQNVKIKTIISSKI